MNKYIVYDKDGNCISTVHAATESEALRIAKVQNSFAVSVQLISHDRD